MDAYVDSMDYGDFNCTIDAEMGPIGNLFGHNSEYDSYYMNQPAEDLNTEFSDHLDTPEEPIEERNSEASAEQEVPEEDVEEQEEEQEEQHSEEAPSSLEYRIPRGEPIPLPRFEFEHSPQKNKKQLSLVLETKPSTLKVPSHHFTPKSAEGNNGAHKRYKSSGKSNFYPDGSRKTCLSCGTRSTPYWRDGWNNSCLCNACGIRYKKYGTSCKKCDYVPRADEKHASCPRCNKPFGINTKHRHSA